MPVPVANTAGMPHDWVPEGLRGLKLNMKDLYADSCSGIVLLKVMDRLEPGAVDWSSGRVAMAG